MPSLSTLSNKLHQIANPDLLQQQQQQLQPIPESHEMKIPEKQAAPEVSVAASTQGSTQVQPTPQPSDAEDAEDRSVTSSDLEGDLEVEVAVSRRLKDLAAWLQSDRPPAVPEYSMSRFGGTSKSADEMNDLSERLTLLAQVLVGESSLEEYDHDYGSAAAAAVGRKAAVAVAAKTKIGKSHTIVATNSMKYFSTKPKVVKATAAVANEQASSSIEDPAVLLGGT